MTRSHRSPVRSAAHTQRLIWPLTPLAALLLLALAVLAAGCGASAASLGGSPAQDTADATHRAWIQAMRDGTADIAQALADPALPEPAAFAQDAVARMQDYLTNLASPTGALQQVMVEPVVDGTGRSVWQFAQKRWCYRAELVSRSQRWYVSRWGQTSSGCQ